MSENQNRELGGLEKYDAMSTEALEALLRQDADTPVDWESDSEEILYIMEVLTERKKKEGHSGKTALEAYEAFKKNYLSEDEIPDTEAEKRRPCRFRGLTAAAAVLVILLLGTVISDAFGLNIWKSVVKWTRETFSLGEWDESNVDNTLPYDSFKDALKEANVPVSLIPKQIPEGYALVNVTIGRDPLKKKYLAQYMNGEQSLVIAVQKHLDSAPFYVEQQEGLIEKYETSGVAYYLFADIDSMKAIWISGNYECSITGELTVDELKMMIDSI